MSTNKDQIASKSKLVSIKPPLFFSLSLSLIFCMEERQEAGGRRQEAGGRSADLASHINKGKHENDITTSLLSLAGTANIHHIGTPF